MRRELLAISNLYCGDCAGHSGQPPDAAQDLRDAIEAYRFDRTAECVFASDPRRHPVPRDARVRRRPSLQAPPCHAREEGTTSCAVGACCIEGGQFAGHECDGFETCATLGKNVERCGYASLKDIREMGLDARLTSGDHRWFRSVPQPARL